MEINSQERFKNLMAVRPAAETKEEQFRYDHAAVTSQAIKTINSQKADPFVKRVVTLRLMSPLVTGRSRSHLSIALELGASERDVIQAEQEGMVILYKIMTCTSMQEIVDKFNRDREANDAVKQELGKRSN